MAVSPGTSKSEKSFLVSTQMTPVSTGAMGEGLPQGVCDHGLGDQLLPQLERSEGNKSLVSSPASQSPPGTSHWLSVPRMQRTKEAGNAVRRRSTS